MAEYKIKVIIKSEAIFGSGKSKGQIHEDCLYDKDGFIYYSGKTLKGMLRKTAKLITDNCKELKGSIEGLFGTDYDDSKKCLESRSEGKLRFSNLTVSEGIRNNLKANLNPTSLEVLSAMTHIRNFIKIGKNGVTEKGALRNIRTIRENMVLFSELGKLDLEREEKLLALIVKNTRHLGMNVSKGRGEVKMTLLKDNREVEVRSGEVISK